MQRIEALSQRRGARLQYVGRFNLENLLVLDGADALPPCTGCHLFRTKLLATPRADDDVWIAANDLGTVSNDAVFT